MGEAANLGNLGLVARDLGNYRAARSYFEQALAIDQKLNYRLGETTALRNLGLLAKQLGDYEAARDYLEQSRAIYKKMGVPVPEAVTNALNELANMNDPNPTEQP